MLNISKIRSIFAFCIFSTLMFLLSVQLMPTAAQADDFDFSEDDGTTQGDFDFTEPAPASLPKEPDFVMPNSGKPINLVFFEVAPGENTERRTIDALTEALVNHMKEFEEYDTAKAVPIIKKLDEMSPEDRQNCIYAPECIANMARELKVAYVVIGKLQTLDIPRPKISLELIDANTSSMKNFIEFETQPRLGTQEKDLKPAVYSLYDKKIADISELMTSTAVEQDSSLPLGQLISGIAVGVVGLTAIGIGIKFGIDAKNNNDNVKKINSANEDALAAMKPKSDVNSVYNDLLKKRQTDAKKEHDNAKKNAMIANILYATGGVAIAVSAILFLVTSDAASDDAYVDSSDTFIAPGLTNDGAGIVAGFKF